MIKTTDDVIGKRVRVLRGGPRSLLGPGGEIGIIRLIDYGFYDTLERHDPMLRDVWGEFPNGVTWWLHCADVDGHND